MIIGDFMRQLKTSPALAGRTKNENMKNINLVITASILILGFSACKPVETEADARANQLTMYVDSIQNLTPVYTVTYWAELEKGYQERVVELEGKMDRLNEEARVQLEASMAKYNDLKASYQENIRSAEAAIKNATDYRTGLRNKLFGEGVIGSDMSFGFVTADNILDVYTRFVNNVQDNKDNYSREDWDEIKVLYEALDTRKNAVEKDVANGVNTKIAGLKIKFAAIKAMNRGGTKGEENREAKDKS
jgi:hypothetical protein